MIPTRQLQIAAGIIILAVLFSCAHKPGMKKFEEAQDHAVPAWNYSPENKTALCIFPHPDDEITSAGAILQLKSKGWKVHLLTLSQGNENEKAVRSNEWKRAGQLLGFDSMELLDLPNNPWEKILSNQLEFWYDEQDSIDRIVENKIWAVRPSVVITYDTCLGAYGHPEHRLTAVAVMHAFIRRPELKEIKILMVTLPDALEELFLAGKESYENARKLTGNPGLPAPTVAFDILPQWPEKAAAANAYVSQLPILEKFGLIPETNNSEKHFRTFSREYFSVAGAHD